MCIYMFDYKLIPIHAGHGATVNVAKPKPNSSVAIFGLGAVGLAVCCPFLLFYLVIKYRDIYITLRFSYAFI